jgi:hypothetical protein
MPKGRNSDRRVGARAQRAAATGRFVSREKVVKGGGTVVVETVTRSSKDAIKKGSKRFAKALESLAKR